MDDEPHETKIGPVQFAERERQATLASAQALIEQGARCERCATALSLRPGAARPSRHLGRASFRIVGGLAVAYCAACVKVRDRAAGART